MARGPVNPDSPGPATVTPRRTKGFTEDAPKVWWSNYLVPILSSLCFFMLIFLNIVFQGWFKARNVITSSKGGCGWGKRPKAVSRETITNMIDFQHNTLPNMVTCIIQGRLQDLQGMFPSHLQPQQPQTARPLPGCFPATNVPMSYPCLSRAAFPGGPSRPAS